MKRVRNFVTLCGGRYPLGLKLNDAQAKPRLVSVRFFYGAFPYLSYGSFRPGSDPEWFSSPQMIEPGPRGFLFAREERRKENFCDHAQIKFYRTTRTTWSVTRLKEDWNWSVLVEYAWRRASESQWTRTPSTSTEAAPQICSFALKGSFFSLDNLIFLITCYSPISYEPLFIKIVAP